MPASVFWSPLGGTLTLSADNDPVPELSPRAARRIGNVGLVYGAVQGAMIVWGLATRDFNVSNARNAFPFVAFWICAIGTFAGAWLRFRDTAQRQPTHARAAVMITALAVFTVPFYVDYEQTFSVWWQPYDVMVRYLTEKTPSGTSQADVERWLNSQYAPYTETVVQPPQGPHSPQPGVGPIELKLSEPPHLPLTGQALEAEVDQHGFGPWRAAVMAQYEFDAAHRLVQITVRRIGTGAWEF